MDAFRKAAVQVSDDRRLDVVGPAKNRLEAIVTVLRELLDWSKGRPLWQRDALRRLVLQGELSENDIGDLAEVCKAAHGLAEQKDAQPLLKEHLPDQGSPNAPVSLVSIFHRRGVNALAEGQTLTFAPNLTVVYGDNAAGKTGYIRILKSACRARGREEILGNVLSGTSPTRPVVAIKYRVGDEEDVREWAGAGQDDSVSRVSVFDARSATVYLTERTDVAFRPFGLDLFDKVVRACKAIRSQLEREQRALVSNEIASVQAKVGESTAAGRLLANISSLTKPETVQELCTLSAADESRLALVERSIADLRASDPQRLVRELNVRVGRLQALRTHMENVEAVLAEDAIGGVFATRAEGREKRAIAAAIRERTFDGDILSGTGLEIWADLWNSARRFSEELAYPDEPFPVIRDGSRCVLCQQNLDQTASQRLVNFETFVTSTVERELQQVRSIFARQRRTFAELNVQPDFVAGTVEEAHLENTAAAEGIRTWFAKAEARRSAVVHALSEDHDLEDCPMLAPAASVLDGLIGDLRERVDTLNRSARSAGGGERVRLDSELEELRARNVLADHKQVVLDEIDRKRRFAAYGLCIADTRSQAITIKSGAVTRRAVTEKLKGAFRTELSKLAFQDVEVELTDAGGTEGVLYHKIVLTRAPGVDLPKVVSEGEQRCLSIAAFFAELSTAEDPSGIVFDDPVSSLDYKWREGVARRLVEEAADRQVIVFTHDVVFLHLLKEIANQKGVNQQDQHVRKLASGAGVCVTELPWVALKVQRRIGHLRKLLQDARKLHSDEHWDAYEKDASVIYGLLREAWERALEEVLLGGVVERFRPSVQTRQVGMIADITFADCNAVEAAMTKCSKWLPGHDQAAAAPAEMPLPDDLQSDIEALATWVKDIRDRRR